MGTDAETKHKMGATGLLIEHGGAKFVLTAAHNVATMDRLNASLVFYENFYAY